MAHRGVAALRGSQRTTCPFTAVGNRRFPAAGDGAAMTHAYRPPPALAATDFWMLSHHERSGQLLVPERVVAIGLAAALLAELVAEDRIGFDQQQMVVPVTEFPPRDAVAHQVLDQLHGEDRLPVQVWVR